jgi:hypothetical protein
MKPVVYFVASVTVLVVIWIAYDLVRSRSCEQLLEQSAPSLRTSIGFLNAKGEIALGRTQIQALSEGADKLNVQLKACCISRQKQYISDAEYKSCLQRAQAYEGRVREVKKNVEQAQTAKASREPDRAAQLAERAQELARIALGSVATGAMPPAASSPPFAPPKTDAAIGGGPQPPDAEAELDASAPKIRDAERDVERQHSTD